MEFNVVYIVLECTGSYEDYREYPIFATFDKDKADKWVAKFNRIIFDNQDRIYNFYYDNDYSKQEPLWYERISEKPMARVVEVKIK